MSSSLNSSLAETRSLAEAFVVPERHEDASAHFPSLVALARHEIASAATDAAPERLEEAVRAALQRDRDAVRLVVASLIAGTVTRAAAKKAARRATRRNLDFVAGKLADDLLADQEYLTKIVKWVAINIQAWRRDNARGPVVVTDDTIRVLLEQYLEDTTQAFAELLMPPHQSEAYLAELLGSKPREGKAPLVPEIPRGMLVVLSSGHYQGLREALYKNTFRQIEGSPWPTAILNKGGTKGYAQLRPSMMDVEPLAPETQIEAWVQTMWRQQRELSDLDADALDALCAIYLNQAREPDDAGIADVDEILAMRGLKPKRGGQGRRGGYEPEQRGEMIRALSHIQNLWINIAEVKVYEKDRQGKRSKQPVLKTLQSRPFIITDRLGQIRLDGDMDVERFIFRPGKAFAAFLFGAGRQTGLLFQKALHYDPLRRKWEKRLTRYISWHWRAVARSGNFVQTYRVQTLLEAVGETVNERYPAKTRARLEKALDTLQADTVIAHWEYARWDEAITERRGWADEWLLATITIEAPDAIKEYYARLGGPERDTRAIEDKSGARAAPVHVGERIKRHRKELDLSQLQASEQLAIQQGYLSKLERGLAEPSTKLARKIEDWLAG